MNRILQTQTECYWRTLAALRCPVIEAETRSRAASTLWQTARCAATPVLRDRAIAAMQRFGLVVTRLDGRAG